MVEERTFHRRIAAGDHTIIVGQVRHAQVREKGTPAVYVDRSFAHAASYGALGHGAVRPVASGGSAPQARPA